LKERKVLVDLVKQGTAAKIPPAISGKLNVAFNYNYNYVSYVQGGYTILDY
jgi:hypothetical protein